MTSDFYTGTGDDGNTIVGSRRVGKDSALMHAIGDVNELNAVLGVALQNLDSDMISNHVRAMQNELFVIGAELAASEDPRFTPKRTISGAEVKALEEATEEVGAKVGQLKSFVLPGGPSGAAYLDYAATVARRAERSVVRLSIEKKGLNPKLKVYVNRLSSYLFYAARCVNKEEGAEEQRPVY